MSKFAVCITDQGRFAPHIVGEFVFQPKESLHVWKGKFATTMSELAEQVNAAVAFMPTFFDAFTTLRIVETKEEPEVQETFGAVSPFVVMAHQTLPETEKSIPLPRVRKRRPIESEDLKGAFG